jgi:MFS family permease
MPGMRRPAARVGLYVGGFLGPFGGGVIAVLIPERSAWVSAAAFLAYLAITGLAFLVALRAADAFGLGPTSRGLLLAGFGAAGVAAGRPAGALVDRVGTGPVVTAGALACAALVPLMGVAGSPGLLAAVWLAVGAGSALVWAGLNTLAVQSAPANRAGAVSVVGAFKFAGSAVAPAVWLPIYEARAWAAFAAAGAGSAAIAAVARRGRTAATRRAHP